MALTEILRTTNTRVKPINFFRMGKPPSSIFYTNKDKTLMKNVTSFIDFNKI